MLCFFHWLNVDALVILLSFQSRIIVSLNDSPYLGFGGID